jgi:hypothetical protein
MGLIARLLCAWMIAVGLGRAGMVAQEQEAPTPTLHVYANLIQIPVLVLTSSLGRVAPIAANKFSVSLDDGPLFRATHVRLEGDDPISLAIFLDTGEAQEGLLTKIDEAIAGLAPGSLRTQDQVFLFAMNCSQLRIVKHVRPERESLKHAVDDALQIWTSRAGERHREKCSGGTQLPHLRSAMMYAMRTLANESGRRVMLAVTDGNDGGGTHPWDEVRKFAGSSGIAIFGMTYDSVDMGWSVKWAADDNDAFRWMCESTGGLKFQVTKANVSQRMTQFVTELRGRYIVEFPRPYDTTGGEHDLVVKIEKSKFFVRPAGISVPIPDKSTLADPMTVPSDPKLAPELGTKRVMSQTQ